MSRWHKGKINIVNLDRVSILRVVKSGNLYQVEAETYEGQFTIDDFPTEQLAKENIDLIIRRDDVRGVR
jgi:hypothetical protein